MAVDGERLYELPRKSMTPKPTYLVSCSLPLARVLRAMHMAMPRVFACSCWLARHGRAWRGSMQRIWSKVDRVIRRARWLRLGQCELWPNIRLVLLRTSSAGVSSTFMAVAPLGIVWMRRRCPAGKCRCLEGVCWCWLLATWRDGRSISLPCMMASASYAALASMLTLCLSG